ncbi:TetR/AcrR family transcriptional regulator [Georgenia alba]|uniref:TetR/AcrR family transcriptional regulator n=1 Tax=Georgenia alba TaxID=2233858 RepID=A0ABW2QFZ7_9MICO
MSEGNEQPHPGRTVVDAARRGLAQDGGEQSEAGSREQERVTRSLELLWYGLPQLSKGPRRTLTLERIVETAITIADAEGLDALSMRRLARDLDVGTMSLYRYVPDKAVLLDLMLDRLSEPGAARTDFAGKHWREVLELNAIGTRELYLAHPWLMQVNWTRPVLGPSSIAGLDLVMSYLADLPMSDQERMMIVSTVDGYVTGAARQEIQYNATAAEAGLSDEEFWSAQLPFLERAMNSGDYPTMAEMSEDTFDVGWEQSFRFGLELLLDGLEREIERRRD